MQEMLEKKSSIILPNKRDPALIFLIHPNLKALINSQEKLQNISISGIFAYDIEYKFFTT